MYGSKNGRHVIWQNKQQESPEEELEDTKGVIIICISRMTRQYKDQSQMDKQRSTKHTYKTKDRVTRTPLNTSSELRCSGRVSSSCSTGNTRRGNLVTNPVINIVSVFISNAHVLLTYLTKLLCLIVIILLAFNGNAQS